MDYPPLRAQPRLYRVGQYGNEYCSWWPRPLVQGFKVVIYGLRGESEAMFSYVGSSHQPCIRLHAHWYDRRKARDAKGQWLADLAARGECLILVVLEMTTLARREKLEQRWIRFLREQGHPLTNRREW